MDSANTQTKLPKKPEVAAITGLASRSDIFLTRRHDVALYIDRKVPIPTAPCMAFLLANKILKHLLNLFM